MSNTPEELAGVIEAKIEELTKSGWDAGVVQEAVMQLVCPLFEERDELIEAVDEAVSVLSDKADTHPDSACRLFRLSFFLGEL